MIIKRRKRKKMRNKRERRGGRSWERGRGAYMDEIDEVEVETLRERAGP